jgi:hypothetical protein
LAAAEAAHKLLALAIKADRLKDDVTGGEFQTEAFRRAAAAAVGCLGRLEGQVQVPGVSF